MVAIAAAQASTKTPSAVTGMAYFKPAELTKFGPGDYLLTGQVDRSTEGKIRLHDGTFTIALRNVMPGGATPVAPPPRPLTKPEMHDLADSLSRFIKKGPTNLAQYLEVRGALRTQFKAH